MAFRFRLQSVLDHRKHLEEKAQGEMAARLQKQLACQRQLEWIAGEMTRNRQELARRGAQGISAQEFALAGDYATTLRLHQMRAGSQLELLKAETEIARQKLLAATRDRKAMDILRERHLQDYLAEERRQERIAMDEAAVRGFLGKADR